MGNADQPSSLSRSVHVAYLGPQGTFSHQAAKSLDLEVPTILTPVSTLTQVMEGVVRHDYEAGVLPFENSTNGHVVPVLDLLQLYMEDITIIREHYLNIQQSLLSGTTLSRIKRLYSHPQAFGQCERWLGKHLPRAERINVDSTGRAAELASKDTEGAAIGSRFSADTVDGLQVVFANIEDDIANTTRFFMIVRKVQLNSVPANFKTILCFRPCPSSSVLPLILDYLTQAHLEVINITSRPDFGKQQLWHCVYFLELRSTPHSVTHLIQKSLAEFAHVPYISHVRVLGWFQDVRAGDVV